MRWCKYISKFSTCPQNLGRQQKKKKKDIVEVKKKRKLKEIQIRKNYNRLGGKVCCSKTRKQEGRKEESKGKRK